MLESQETIMSTPLDEAVRLHKSGKIQEAEIAYQHILDENPDQDGAVYRLGVLCAQTGRLDDAVTHMQKAIKMNPDDVEYQNSLALVFLQKGELPLAQKFFHDALRLDPNHAGIYNNLGTLLASAGDIKKAEEHFRKAIELAPKNHDACNNLGRLFHNQNNANMAESWYQEALRLKPDYAKAWVNLGDIIKSRTEFKEAEECYKKATESDPFNLEAWSRYGSMLRHHGHIDEALACLNKALDLNPRYIQAYQDIAVLLERTNQHNEIQTILKKGRQYIPDHPVLAIIEARLFRHDKNYEESIRLLEPHRGLPGWSGMKINFELGQLYDFLKETDKAFPCFQKAKTMLAQTSDAKLQDQDHIFNHIDKNEAAYTRPGWFQNWDAPIENSHHPDPVFLLGFPRSGTTLLDQILSGHPDIFVAEEKASIGKSLETLNDPTYPECLATISPDMLEDMRNAFFEEHKSAADWQEQKVFIDKMPLNTIHMGLTYKMFPNARYILALRHPCDCVLSCFMHPFHMNQAMVQFNDLERAAKLYSRTMDLLKLYEKTLPIRLHKVRYEGVVTDLRHEAEEILSFLDLPWNDAVLEHDKTAKNRTVNTPSQDQVTEKIYDRAKFRWLRYKNHMEPVLDTLRPWAKEFGYEEEEM